MKKKRTREKNVKITLIIESFLTLIKERGYNQFHTNHIADHAQISVGTIYRYFPKGKHDILKNSFDYISNKIFNIDEYLEFEPEDFPKIITKIVQSSLIAHRSDLNYHKALLQEMLVDHELYDKFQEDIYQYNLEIVNYLRSISVYFHSIPKSALMNRFRLIFQIIDMFVDRHVLISPLFDNDKQFIDYVTKILLFTIEGFDSSLQ